MSNWSMKGNLGELQDGNGNWLSYGDFGTDTYGLHTTIGEYEACICVSGTNDADAVLEKLASGWRPVNWPTNSAESM